MTARTDDADTERFRALLAALADVFAAEGRAGGDAAAAAYRAASRTALAPPRRPPYKLDATIREASAGAAHPAARAAAAAHAVLPWTATGILEEEIPTTVSDVFAVASLAGPDAPVHAEGIRSGIYVQSAESYYPLHAHTAEETYAMLAGDAEWTLEGCAPRWAGPGMFIHHGPEAGHATRTGPKPFLAAWRWSGDIRRETYRMLEAG